MELFINNALWGAYYFQQLDSAADDIEVPFCGDPYVCLVWDSRGDSTKEERLRLASTLWASGCRHMVCAGKSCEEWHDSADEAFHFVYPKREDDSWMTTGHKNESANEVAFYVVYCTAFQVEGLEFFKYLVLQIGPDEATKKHILDSLNKHVLERTLWGTRNGSVP